MIEPPQSHAPCRSRLLVIRGGAIGDFILTLPVLSALRRHCPEARIEVLGYPHIAQVALAGGLADAVRPIESRSLAAAFAPGAALSEDLASYFSGFDLVVSYLYDPDRIFEENVARVSSARFVAGPHRPDSSGDRHAADVLLEPLAQIGIVAADPIPRLRLRVEDVALTQGRTAAIASGGSKTRCLAVHPGSGSERKNWPESRWAELLSRLAAQTDCHLLLVGGEAEGDRLERLAACWPADRIAVARSLPLVELAHRLAASHFFLGHDTGIMHLAAALGLPGLVLWGESPLSVWRPRQGGMQCLAAGTHLSRLDVEEVWAALAFWRCAYDAPASFPFAPCQAGPAPSATQEQSDLES